MNEDRIDQFILKEFLRKRSPDKEKVKSLLESSATTMSIVKTIPLDEKSATLIFRETYESIRQLGDALWWLKGYEARNHEVSMEILQEADVKEKVKLNRLNRFKQIRNDANYRGFKVTAAQAKEILEFWNTCGKDIMRSIEQKVK